MGKTETIGISLVYIGFREEAVLVAAVATSPLPKSKVMATNCFVRHTVRQQKTFDVQKSRRKAVNNHI